MIKTNKNWEKIPEGVIYSDAKLIFHLTLLYVTGVYVLVGGLCFLF